MDRTEAFLHMVGNKRGVWHSCLAGKTTLVRQIMISPRIPRHFSVGRLFFAATALVLIFTTGCEKQPSGSAPPQSWQNGL